MKNFFALIVLIKLFLITLIVNSYAALGIAAVYKVTMKKVELCTGSTGITDCTDAVIVGSGTQVVDIAAVDAGSAAASYGTPAELVLGTTYTHIRVTIDRKFTMKSTSTGIDTGSSSDTDKCVTIATTDGMYRNDEASEKYTVKPVFAEDGTLAEFRTYMVSDDYYQCAHAACSGGSANNDQTYGTKYAAYQEQHTSTDLTDEHMLVYVLTVPYTVAMQPPTIDIAFGTQEALGAYQVDDGAGNNFCSMWAEEPVVAITIK